MPKTKEPKKETRLVDPQLAMAIRQYHAIKESRKQMVITEEDLKTNMLKLLVPYEQEFKSDVYLVDGAKVNLIQVKGRSTIHSEKLLDQGVDPEVIGRATTTGDPYVRYDVGEE